MGSRWNTAITFGTEKVEWWVYQMVKKLENMFTRFDTMHKRDGHWTEGHCTTARAALAVWLCCGRAANTIAGPRRARYALVVDVCPSVVRPFVVRPVVISQQKTLLSRRGRAMLRASL